MGTVLAILALIAVGVIHIMAVTKEWGWFMNNYQVKGIEKSLGKGGLRAYTYAASAGCIGFGLYLAATAV